MDRETIIRDMARAICCPRGCAQEATGAPYCEADLCDAAARAALPIALEAAAKVAEESRCDDDGDPFNAGFNIALEEVAARIRLLAHTDREPDPGEERA